MNQPFKKPLVVIGVPTNGEHSFLFSQSVQGMIQPSNFSMQIVYIPFMEVGRARNIIVGLAREVGAKFLMFWDEDVIAEANGLRRLVAHLLMHEDWSVAAGAYATKTHPPEPLIYTDWVQGANYGWKRGEMVRVKATGCGFTMFRMADFDLFDQDAAPYYEERNVWTGKPMMVQNFFNTGTSSRVVEGCVDKLGWTEDMYFFKMAEKLDLKVYVDTSIELHHYDKREAVFYDIPIDSDMVARKAEPWNHDPLVCNLGAGKLIDPYAVNVDLRDDPRVFKCDIRALPAEWGEKFDLVKACHVLEHFPYPQTDGVLDEWLRIVKPGGKLHMELPDLEWAAKQILTVDGGALDTYLMGLIWGDQGHEMWNQDPYGGEVDGRFREFSWENNNHKAGFTPAYITARLETKGMTDIQITRQGFQFTVEATKPHGEKVDGHQGDAKADQGS